MNAQGAAPDSVLAAYGLVGPGEPLPGGQGTSVRYGDVVLKPGADEVEAARFAATLAQVVDDGFRLARLLPTLDGRWSVGGWTATAWVPGAAGPVGRWPELLAAARAFHAAIAAVPRPDFLTRRDNPWATADQVAFGERKDQGEVDVASSLSPTLVALQRVWRPIGASSQLVHADLAGNVLFATALPPAIIDLSLYWRPAAYADAIIAVDGRLWWGAGPELFQLAAVGAEFSQLLVRAVIFRLVAHSELIALGADDDPDQTRWFEAVAAQAIELARGG